ncbi:MAG: M2 family metallopeptidase [Candidatus Eisenbacteria bacterium]|nr:M2 family metallopeptidase [Candidatus Eisenbacteria bacterium]
MGIADAALERRTALGDFITDLVGRLEPLQRRHNDAVWLANVTGEQRYEQESARLDAEIRTMFSAREPYEFLKGLAAAGGVDDAHLARQLTLLIHDYRAHQIPPEMIQRIVGIEKALESRFNNFRAALDGRRVTDNEIRQVLRDSDDSAARRLAWEASKQIGAEVAEDLRALVRLRNRAAVSLGFSNYYSMMLELDELDERELFALLDDLDTGTQPLFETYKGALDARLAKRFGLATEALRPWHYTDPFFQEAPAAEVELDPWFRDRSLEDLTLRFFAAIGFDIRDLVARSDLYEKPGKSQHAFCISMDRGADVRVLCNIQPSEYWMATMLHEYGHAVYDQQIDRSLPYLLRVPAHILTTEASAMLFGRLSKSAAWLTAYAGVPEDEARAGADALARAGRDQLLVQTRWELVMCNMERALYRDPEQDLDALWWDLVERYQWVRRPEGRCAPDWASKIHFSVAPVYYHNYMLGEMMASQLQRHLLDRVLGGGVGAWRRFVASPEVGAFMTRQIYRGGKERDWRETLRRATGQTLTAAAFVEELAGRS